MKNTRQERDQELNELAIAYAGGNEEAGDQFASIVYPWMATYAKRRYSQMEKDELTQELMIEALKACKYYASRYAEQGGNVMGLVWSMCKQRHIDIGRHTSAQRRAEIVEVGEEKMRRSSSLHTLEGGGEEGIELIERLSNGEKLVEEQAVEKEAKQALLEVVKDFTSRAKGRNKEIVPLIYTATQLDWEEEYLQDRIGDVIESQTGKYPNNATIRKAKSRAIDALKTFMEHGDEYFMAEELGL